jgi:hypothetical protein
MTFLKQLAYTGDVTIPMNGELKTVPLQKNLFTDMVKHFQDFKKQGIKVPVTNQHGTNKVADTLGYVLALWEQKDGKGRDSLYCAVDFNEKPDGNVLKADVSLESPAFYTVSRTGETIRNPLTAVTVTPTPVLAGMEPFSLALSLGSNGETPTAATNLTPANTGAHTMPEQLAALLFEFLGVDPTQYEGKDTELLEFVAKSLAELRKTPEAAPTADTPAPAEDEVKVEVEAEPAKAPDEKDEQIAELTLSLNAMRQEIRLNKLNELASQGKLSKPAFDKAKSMYGGNLALSRDKEFNDFLQVIAMNKPVVNTQSLTGLQTLQKPPSGIDDPMEKAQAKKYGKK